MLGAEAAAGAEADAAGAEVAGGTLAGSASRRAVICGEVIDHRLGLVVGERGAFFHHQVDDGLPVILGPLRCDDSFQGMADLALLDDDLFARAVRHLGRQFLRLGERRRRRRSHRTAC